MNQLRLDPLSGRWVVVSPGRSERPYSFVTRSPELPDPLGRPCPFCPGNEEDTLPALETYGPSGGWLVRVVPNLYPAFAGDEPFVVANRGPVFTQATAGGIHEILIFSPEHDATLGQLSQEQVELVMAALRDRLEEHASQPNLRYTQAIVNSDARPEPLCTTRTASCSACPSSRGSWPKSRRASRGSSGPV
jgi:UDPglucose--hexose-1-phosphate uridylyltransferase